VLDFQKLALINCFNNDSKLQDINCQIFLIHGKKDEVIPQKRSEALLKLNQKIISWFPKKGDHNNIQVQLREKFINKCINFLDQLRYFQKDYITCFANNSNSNLNMHCLFKIEENYIQRHKTDISDITDITCPYLAYEMKNSKSTKNVFMPNVSSFGNLKEKYLDVDKADSNNDKASTSHDDLYVSSYKTDKHNYLNKPKKLKKKLSEDDINNLQFRDSGSFYEDSVDFEKNEQIFNIIKKDTI